MSTRTTTLVLLIALLLAASGCIGITKSSPVFLNPPSIGMTVVDMVKTYGAPVYTASSGDETVYVYRVMDHAHYVAYGYNEDLDLVVVCKNGAVTEVKNVKAGSGMAILHPTWIED